MITHLYSSYFETEPMNIKSFKPVKLSDEAVKSIKENIKELRKIFKAGEENLKKYEKEIVRLNLYNKKYFKF